MRITVSAICTSVISSYVDVVDSDWASAGTPSPDSLLDTNGGIEVEDAAESDADIANQRLSGD